MSWSDVNSSKSRGPITRLKIGDGQTVEVRFISEPHRYLQYFNQETRKSAICGNRDDCIIHKKYRKTDGSAYEPEVRFAIQVIDRADKTVKLLECPPSVLKPVSAWMERRKRNAADPKQGIDFSITRTGQKKQTRYEVVPLDPTPLTDEELALVEANKLDLSKLYKPTPDNEIEAKLGFVDVPAGTTAAAQPAEQPVAVGAGAGENKGVELPF